MGSIQSSDRIKLLENCKWESKAPCNCLCACVCGCVWIGKNFQRRFCADFWHLRFSVLMVALYSFWSIRCFTKWHVCRYLWDRSSKAKGEVVLTDVSHFLKLFFLLVGLNELHYVYESLFSHNVISPKLTIKLCQVALYKRDWIVLNS